MRAETGDKGQGTRDVSVKPIRSYQDLEIWQEGIQLVSQVYNMTKEFPREENYGLTSQMRRAAVSVPTNITEGYARNHRAELRQFLYIALGSLAELETLGIVASELGYIERDQVTTTFAQPFTRLRHRTLALLRKLR